MKSPEQEVRDMHKLKSKNRIKNMFVKRFIASLIGSTFVIWFVGNVWVTSGLPGLLAILITLVSGFAILWTMDVLFDWAVS